MERNCKKCKAHLESEWAFCPLCGDANEPESAKMKAPAEHEKAPVQGAFSGLLFGMVAVPILIIVGTLLCLTGLGALLGIPMIILAVFAPLLGPVIGLDGIKGKCPWCGTTVSTLANAKDFGCLECGHRISIRHREFVKVS